MKLIIAGLVGIIATLAGWFAGQTLSSSSGSADAQEKPPQIEQLVTEMNGAPVIVDGRVQGYLVFRVKSEIDKAKLKDPKFEIAPFLTGSAFEAAYKYFENGVPTIRPNDLPNLKALIVEIANKKLGDKIVQSVEFEQFNYISSDKVRENIFSKDKSG